MTSPGGLVTKSCPTLVTPWTVACQAPLSIGFSRQKYWSRLPFSSPGDLPDPGIEFRSSCTAGRFFINWASKEVPWPVTQFYWFYLLKLFQINLCHQCISLTSPNYHGCVLNCPLTLGLLCPFPIHPSSCCQNWSSKVKT